MPKHVVALKSNQHLEDQRPTISLAMTATQAEPSVLDPLIPHVDELVVVSAISDHNLLDRWKKHLLDCSKPTKLIKTSPQQHPHIYETDTSSTFTTGSPLADESYPFQHTEAPFVSDWSALRHLAWSECEKEWRLSMRDDEILDRPDLLRHLGQTLDQHGRDIAFGHQTVGRLSLYSGRFASNIPEITYSGSARESLEYGNRPAVIEGSLTTTCSTDRNISDFRVLYAEARRKKWDVAPTNLLHLAQISLELPLENFTERAIATYLELSLYPEERAWAHSLRGELLEKNGCLEEASRSYQSSLLEHPTWKNLLRLCRIFFKLDKWNECIESYSQAISSIDQPCLCDNYSTDPNLHVIFVAHSLKMISQPEECCKACNLLRQIFPASESIANFCRSLENRP